MTPTYPAATPLDWLGDYWRTHIVDTGRQPAIFLLIALIVTFVVVRVITFGIRAGARWAPKNVTPGGLHIHHMVPGLILMLLAGFVGLGLQPVAPWAEILAVLFGIGAALVLDEFALVLHLDDVYWSEEGRGSVDAVILAVIFTGLMVVGLAPLGLSHSAANAVGLLFVVVVICGLGFDVVTALKGKLPMAIIGLFVPTVSVFGAVRLAHPSSPWARARYASDPGKAEEAQRRYQASRWPGIKGRILDLFSGVPARAQPAEAGAGEAGPPGGEPGA